VLIMLVPFTSQAVRVTVRGLEQDVILASKVVVAGVSIMGPAQSGIADGPPITLVPLISRR
jgi:hypothetical protein